MTIYAVALLRVPPFAPPLGSGMRVEPLDDAVLVHTADSFAEEPAALARRLTAVLDTELADHDDPRGVFVLPSVASPTARSYAGVLDEVGAGGQWLAIAAPGEALDGFCVPDGFGGLAAVFGSMIQHMPEAVLEAAAAAARGDEAGFSAVGEHVAAMLGHVPARPGVLPDAQSLGASAEGLLGMLSGAGLDVSSPAFQQALGAVEAELARDPARVRAIAEQLFGAQGGPDDGEA
jgi:hypothetical protein